MFSTGRMNTKQQMKRPDNRKKEINNAVEEVKNDPMKAQALALELFKKGIKKI